ncbi:MAG TPA: efflux RND transporter periplasmic adaptor subunit [Phycisphaerae bacterium]|jgi:RND family efflux transporter MFP subunit|nr:efflux RND transporter periplasmic adaptor subunit [Phycisphaerae bacterium]HOB73428.1 efflux RND transporter periplasmic adaptor subunit [Phycisphaerae bacterium]HOJ54920.1 efflux RND transporter periplasmic adaptor subunit [Phycisphaerae bacterium]HOL25070.1 efflux RND transporter periplasmic adaptor subunit [Phycisphaerae bacterium]HPP21371.1 efflux RND transporter periplasmic adaptor subunit [Phycisphaerae bacterium]
MSPDKKTLDALRIDRTHASRSRWPAVLVVAVLVAGAAAGGVAWWLGRPKAAVVRTAVVQASAPGVERTLLNASGYVTARREATVSSKVTGKVIEVLVEEGMRVEAGQVLARIDSSNVERSLRLAEAQLESSRKALGETRANLEHAEREVRRLSRLLSEQAASQVETDRAETEARALRARLERQLAEIAVYEREVAVWQQQLEDTVIRAPFAGVVTAKNAQPGEMISPLSVGGFTRTGICTIVDMSSLEIEVDVSESYINRVQPGQPVEATLDSYPNWPIPAKVIAIIPTADRQKATVKVRVGFEKLDPRILPDMSVKVAFQSPEAARRDAPTGSGSADGTTATRPSLTVPKAAVRHVDGRDIVWIVRDGKVERRAVKVGTEQGDRIAIEAGVSDGERVVVEGPDDLTDGAAVTEAKR